MASKSRDRSRPLLWPVAILLTACSVVSAQGEAELESVLYFFTRHASPRLFEQFEASRPASVSPADRARALAMLPSEGEVRSLNAVQRGKLDALRRVFGWHGRETTYVVKVVEIPQAAVALHARAVVLVSAPALDLLESEELQALAAHEIGHEYFWDEYVQARLDDDRVRLRRLELLCDGIGIVTLQQAGIDPGWLTSGLDTIVRYNRARFGRATNEDHYPALKERREFARRLVAWMGRT